MVNPFTSKPFDVEPILKAWTDAPVFLGNPKKDLPVDEWLDKIKVGCVERNVPKEHRPTIAQHYLRKAAKTRFDQIKLAMVYMHGPKYKWSWKTFKTAMRNMGWDLDAKKTKSVQVEEQWSSGLWRFIGLGGEQASKDNNQASLPRPQPTIHKSSPSKLSFAKASPQAKPVAPPKSAPPTPVRASTMSSITMSSIVSSLPFKATPDPAHGTISLVANAPIWLINACQALETITCDNPKIMSAIAAALITVGSIPAIPAVSAGAGGAFLASSAAHTLGSMAVGLGTLLKANEIMNTKA